VAAAWGGALRCGAGVRRVVAGGGVNLGRGGRRGARKWGRRAASPARFCELPPAPCAPARRRRHPV